MGHFITLTTKFGRQLFSVSHIVRVIETSGDSIIVTTEADCPDGITVGESIDRIAALLGVKSPRRPSIEGDPDGTKWLADEARERAAKAEG